MVNQSEYTPIIIQKEFGFCVYLPERKISGEGVTLDDAYREYLKNLKDNEVRSKNYGLATISLDPYPIIRHRSVLRELVTFWLKAFSVFIIGVIVIVLLLPNIRASAEHHISESARFAALKLPKLLNSKIARLTPEEESQISVEWGQLFKNTSSMFIDEREFKPKN